MLSEIVLDTGVIIGYGHVAHQYCYQFFREFPAESNFYHYPKKVKEELKYVRDRIAREHRDENELRRMYQFIDEFLRDAQEIDYEKSSECNWNAIWVVIVSKG